MLICVMVGIIRNNAVYFIFLGGFGEIWEWRKSPLISSLIGGTRQNPSGWRDMQDGVSVVTVSPIFLPIHCWGRRGERRQPEGVTTRALVSLLKVRDTFFSQDHVEHPFDSRSNITSSSTSFVLRRSFAVTYFWWLIMFQRHPFVFKFWNRRYLGIS